MSNISLQYPPDSDYVFHPFFSFFYNLPPHLRLNVFTSLPLIPMFSLPLLDSAYSTLSPCFLHDFYPLDPSDTTLSPSSMSSLPPLSQPMAPYSPESNVFFTSLWLSPYLLSLCNVVSLTPAIPPSPPNVYVLFTSPSLTLPHPVS